MARSLAWGACRAERKAKRASRAEAAQIFEELRRKYPPFRSEEVHICLASIYINLDDFENTREVIDDVFRKFPYLYNDYMFMGLKITASYKPSASTVDWLRDRRAGNPLDKYINR